MSVETVAAAVFVAILIVTNIISALLGKRYGSNRALQDYEEQLSKLENLLKRAGVNLHNEPARLQDGANPSRSWTGIPIPDALRSEPGSIPRWDDPSSHK